jgi:hypothetical protein
MFFQNSFDATKEVEEKGRSKESRHRHVGFKKNLPANTE